MILDDATAVLPIFEHRLLDEMNADPHVTFYLTGSRFAGHSRAGSDYDFLAEDTPAVQRWLAARAFGSMMEGEYQRELVDTPNAGPVGERHPYTTAIYECAGAAGSTEAAVQVKLVTNVAAARCARDLVYGAPVLRQHERELRDTIRVGGIAPDGAPSFYEQRAALWLAAARLAVVVHPAPPAPVAVLDASPLAACDPAWDHDDFPF